jgi:RNA polymerase sigma-70 factor (ECF subfamily)
MHSSATATPAAAAAAASQHPAAASASTTAVGWHELAAHRGHLVAYARRRLQDPALAEDLVHDVFEAVVTGRASFAGRSALRSWLVGVLKHKIVDLVRQRSGHDSLDAVDDDGDGVHAALECPQPGPHDVAEHRQRLAQTMTRIAALPTNLRQVVELRLLHERPTAEVCSALQISEQNLFVRLHRARRALAA